MRLLKANINNFGKIHDQEFDFSEGLNIYNQENGWGKTTLSVFIKSMFYGMEHTTSKDLEKNEKLKYKPWQGGTYGGSLDFEINGNQYKVTRYFGMKKNEDSFELRNLKTNKISTDFSSELGNEIFGVSRETYGRSVLVDLNETPAGSTDISAKLNNLVESGDISDFDDAYETLDKKATSLKAKRGSSGEINLIQSYIDSDRDYLEEINSKIVQNERYISEMNKIKLEVAELEGEQKKLTELLSLSAKYESKLHYDELKEDVEKKEKDRESLINFFNGIVPTEEILEELTKLSASYTTISSNISTQSATQSENDEYEELKKKFAGDVPSQEQIKNCLTADAEYKTILQEESAKKFTSSEEIEYSELEKKFIGKTVSKEIISDKNGKYEKLKLYDFEIQEEKNKKTQKETELRIAELKKPINTKRILFVSLSFLLLAVSIVLFVVVKSYILGGAFAGIAIIFLFCGLKSKVLKEDLYELKNEIELIENDIEQKQTEKEKIENELNLFISEIYPGNTASISIFQKMGIDFNRYEILRNKKEDYEDWLQGKSVIKEKYLSEMKGFVQRYCGTNDISNVSIEVQTLSSKINRLQELEKKINFDSLNQKNRKETEEEISNILRQYKTQKNLSFSEQLKEIESKIAELGVINSNIKDAAKKVSDFEQDPNVDISSFDKLEKPDQTVDELNEMISIKTEEINSRNAELNSYENRLNDNLSDTEKKEDVETEIEKLTVIKHEKAMEYILLERTKNFLSKAKENLDANYSDPMKEGFTKYVCMLGGNENLIIDTDLKVSVDEKGNVYDSAYLSEGYKDMVNFCSRMALVDALFKEVKPPVILDDPFVNLDDDKVPRALNLVSEMAKENQVLYFTCHKSREI